MSLSSLKAQEKNANDSITVSGIIAKYIQALGGRANLEKIYSEGFEASGEYQGKTMVIKMQRANEGQMMSNILMDGKGIQKTVWNGKNGYVIENGVKSPLPRDVRKELLKNQPLFPELDSAFVNKLQLAGVKTVAGERSYVLRGDDIIYYYSIKTGLKTGETLVHTVNRNTVVVPTTYGDYKEVSGIKFPFEFTQRIGDITVDYKISDYSINQVSDDVFQ